MSMTKLVAAYKNTSVDFPNLKAVTLAQWLLESGRGSSFLAKTHLNFGGIKYREELQSKVEGLSKILYDEGRGEDDKFYFKCATETAFIKLYWAFIERAIYNGWRSHTSSARAFITFIANAGYVGGNQAHKNNYIETILGLVPEAEKLLNTQPNEGDTMGILTGVKVALDCGHGYDAGKPSSLDSGAVGNGTIERTEVIVYANRAASILRSWGATVSVFSYEDANATRYTLEDKGKRAAGHHVFVSCHLNAFDNTSVQGTETFYASESYPNDKKLASHILAALTAKLGFTNRGVKRVAYTVLTKVPASVRGSCLIEPWFITAASVGGKDKARELTLKTGDALAEGILSFCKELGLASAEAPTPVPVEPTEPVNPTPPSATTEKFLRAVRVSSKDTLGFQRMELQLCELFDDKVSFRIIDKLPMRSGLLGYQAFRVAAESKALSHEPVPEGYYKLGAVEWKAGADNYNASWKQGIGATWTDCIPLMKTGRSAIGIHLDAGVAGTEGCVGLLTIADEKRYVAWRRAHSLVRLTVNYGLGTVETKLKLVTDAPAPIEPGTMPAPIEPETKPVETPDSKSWLKKFWQALKDFIDGWF